jgi:acyl-CoA thioester hydrolase
MSAGYPVTVTLPVQWGEMDALGHVNNARFFAWFEAARIALFARVGIGATGRSAVQPVLATTSCDFLRPVVHPATVRVGVRVSRVGETSLGMEYEVAEAPDGALYARGMSVAVLVDGRTGQKVRIPDEVRAAIAGLGALSHP